MSWWALFAGLACMLWLGRPAVVVSTGLVSLLALRESLALTGAAGSFPAVAVLAAALYAVSWAAPGPLFTAVLPVAFGVMLLAEGVWRLALRPRLEPTRALLAAVCVALLGPSFVVAVASLPPPGTRPGEALGWLLLLVVLTELNDIAQAWWGRAFGAHGMAPELSPRKTWEGLLGGVVTTVAAATLLAPLLTDYGRAEPPAIALPAWWWPAAVGLLISVAGVSGDLAASWLKRRAGVKDAGHLLPGQGGVLDRVDSLSVTAPVYFAITWLLWFAS